MAITKETQIGKIEVVGKYKFVQVRTDTVVIEDGEELSRKYHRHSLSSNADISNENAEVQAVCNAVWTQDVKDAYTAFKATQEAELGE
jgi:recombinational DNA repair protein RecR